jgi:signal transduction histidine kinase/DNA-binding response OmpR family regulator
MAKVLVVDDREVNRKLLGAILAHEGHDVIEAPGGYAALDLTRTQAPDLVITDLLMPGMDGYELVRQIRTDPAIAHTRVVFQTAHYLEEEAGSLAKACGVQFVLMKPASNAHVIETVRKALMTASPEVSLPPADLLDREHLRLLTDKLAEKADELRVLSARQAALIELSVNLASETNPVQLLQRFARGAREVFGSVYSVVGIVAPASRSVEYYYCAGPEFVLEPESPITLADGGVVDGILATKLPIRLSKPTHDMDSLGMPASLSGISSFLGVPICSDNRVYGWLGLGDKTAGDDFSVDDERLAAIFASQVGRIYENGRLVQVVQQHASDLEREVVVRSRAEQALRDNERRMRQILAASPAAIFSLEVTGGSLVPNWISGNIGRLLGREIQAGGLTTDWWIEQIHPDDLDRVFADVARIPGDDALCEYRVRYADGSYRWIQDHRHVRRNESGSVVEVVGSWIDVTEKRQLEGQLFQSQKMEAIGRLAGGVAHDFNNVLTAILGYSQLMMDRLEHESELREQVLEIQRAGERAAELTRQLLLFSRKQPPRRARVDLNTVISEMERMLGRLIGEDIKLRTVLEPGLAAVKVDPSQIEQVIMNLAVNARDAMPDGGSLIIETANCDLDESFARGHANPPPGRYVVLTVSDTGHGMSTEILSHIFEPFFTTKELGKGTGLGLSTAYAIVEHNRGHLSVYSEVGSGSAFKIYFPRADELAAEAAPAAEPEPLPAGTETILLAEDEPYVRQLAAIVLRERGYSVIECQNGQDAVRLVKTSPALKIDLLLTDVVMPEMGGVALAAWFAAHRPSTRVLFVSAYPDEAISHHGVHDTTRTFLQKPFTPSSLARKVRDVLDSSHSGGTSKGGAA